jgi:hypothetical protein
MQGIQIDARVSRIDARIDARCAARDPRPFPPV